MKTTVPRIGAIHLEPGKEGAVYPSQCWTSVDQKMTGTVKARLSQNLSRNIATECPAWRSWLPWAPDILCLAWGSGAASCAPWVICSISDLLRHNIESADRHADQQRRWALVRVRSDWFAPSLEFARLPRRV